MNAVDVLEALIRIDSVNPAMGGPGEAALADFLSGVLGSLGLEVSTAEVIDGRSNLIARLPGDDRGPTLLFEAHLDTVAHPDGELKIERTTNRLIGRGACDTKGSCAAMVTAIAALAGQANRPSIVFAGTVDEEYVLRGSRALIHQLPPTDAAVIGEPTSLRPVRVHNGLLRFSITAHGRTAHTSKAELGVNAITAAARAILSLEHRLLPVLRAHTHEAAGPALLTPGVIEGGIAANVVPDRCVVHYDRRLSPGEDPRAALAEIDTLLDELRAGGDRITREEPSTLLPAVETASAHPVVRAAEEAVEAVLGEASPAGGVPYGTDASNLAGFGGIPCVVLGPGSIDQAHKPDEWISIEEVRQAAVIYAEMASRFARLWSERLSRGDNR